MQKVCSAKSFWRGNPGVEDFGEHKKCFLRRDVKRKLGAKCFWSSSATCVAANRMTSETLHLHAYP